MLLQCCHNFIFLPTTMSLINIERSLSNTCPTWTVLLSSWCQFHQCMACTTHPYRHFLILPFLALQKCRNLHWQQQKAKTSLYHNPLLEKGYLLFHAEQQKCMGRDCPNWQSNMLCSNCLHCETPEEEGGWPSWCQFSSKKGICQRWVLPNYSKFWGKKQQGIGILGVSVQMLSILHDFASQWCCKALQVWPLYLPTVPRLWHFHPALLVKKCHGRGGCTN